MYISRLSRDAKNWESVEFYSEESQNDINCFFCGKSTTIADRSFRGHDKFAIKWEGKSRNAEIFFHPNCAELFAMHLIKDVRSGELSFEREGK